MQTALHQISDLMQQRKIDAAEKICRQLIDQAPRAFEGWLHLGWIMQIKGDQSAQMQAAEKVVAIQPDLIAGQMLHLEALLALGTFKKAKKTLQVVEKLANGDAALLSRLAEIYTELSMFTQAYGCYDKARVLLKDDPQALYNCASALIPLGDFDQSAALFSRVINKNPTDFDAYYNRATVKKQTIDHNHIDQIKTSLRRYAQDKNAPVPLYYALAKELEDVGDYKQSFEMLSAGAAARRSSLQYDVQDDVTLMQTMIQKMDKKFLTGICENTDKGSKPDAAPIFIVGLPRTGSTLVDRILSSHSAVESMGEISDFVMSFTRMTKASINKIDLLDQSLTLDFDQLGADYLQSISERVDGAFVIDKTPANFLYIGLIAKALPNAKIIHITRNPLDSCYAMYKTLFRMGYPFSYNLDDLAHYYHGYAQLMQHWHSAMPNRIIDISYEDLIGDQEGMTRTLLDACGLDFEEACLSFHTNSSASATASAAQVREPIYKTSVEKWRHYEQELAPLKSTLESLGIDCGAAS